MSWRRGSIGTFLFLCWLRVAEDFSIVDKKAELETAAQKEAALAATAAFVRCPRGCVCLCICFIATQLHATAAIRYSQTHTNSHLFTYVHTRTCRLSPPTLALPYPPFRTAVPYSFSICELQTAVPSLSLATQPRTKFQAVLFIVSKSPLRSASLTLYNGVCSVTPARTGLATERWRYTSTPSPRACTRTARTSSTCPPAPPAPASASCRRAWHR